MTISFAELSALCAENGIKHVGWFKPRQFSKYLDELRKREEYQRIRYRSFKHFEAVGQLPEKFKSIIVIAVDYFMEKNNQGSDFKISNYSRFCWNTIEDRQRWLHSFLNERGYSWNGLDLPARAAACCAGLGAIGRNCCFYIPGVGSYVGIVCLGTDLEFPEEKPHPEYVTTASCSGCNRCVKACPVNAIYPDGYRINPLRCIAFINRHPEEPEKIMPKDVAQLNNWIAGCELCQDVCPMNAGLKHTKDAVIAEKINLGGLTLPNQSSISANELINHIDEVVDPAYKRYIKELIQSQ